LALSKQFRDSKSGDGNAGATRGLSRICPPAESTLPDFAIPARCRFLPHFASAARITRLSPDPDKGMAGRCVQGLIDVLEGNYGGDITKMPYVVNKEAFVK
jgi:glyoxylate reductase